MVKIIKFMAGNVGGTITFSRGWAAAGLANDSLLQLKGRA